MDGSEALAPAPRESALRTLAVALLVCGACAALIAASVVLLRPVQKANQERDRRARVLEMIRAAPGLAELVEGIDASGLEAHMIALETGEVVETDDETIWDVHERAADPELTHELPEERDTAYLETIPYQLPVYLVRDAAALRLVILPIWGEGYISTMWGYLALDGDLQQVRSIQFYEHEETPGLGAEIESEGWRRQWPGKRLRDETGELRIGVSKDPVDPASPDFPYTVDGISGATRTGRAVTRLVRFWLGPDGYGPLLERLAAQGGEQP
jgi:Na+-transporting NADH:ubiquinone oxidoreductase subunit C